MASLREWLSSIGLAQYADLFESQAIDDSVLPFLTDADLEKLGLPLGHRRKLLHAASDLSTRDLSSRDAQLRNAEGAERRQLTVLFFDLVGSTALSQKLDPEDLRELTRKYRDLVVERIEHYGGHVASYMGDGVMAYFGWPRSDENNVERSVRGALEILQAVRQYRSPLNVVLRGRIGIATGKVVVGNIAGESAFEQGAVVGQTPNLAARLQSAAAPDQVVVDSNTRRLLGYSWNCSELGAFPLKGFDEPVTIWLVMGHDPGASRFETRYRNPGGMVGRRRELNRITERWTRAVAGEGQAVVVSGEAGIGKSRLVWAFSDVANAAGHTFVLQCSPFEASTPFHPVIERIERSAEFEPGDSGQAKRSKLGSFLHRIHAVREDLEAPLSELLQIAPEAPVRRPDEARARAFECLFTLIADMAAAKPLCLLIEDIQWADASTLELIRRIVADIRNGRVLLVVTERADEPSTFDAGDCERIHLPRLCASALQEMVIGIAGSEVDPELLRTIAERTDGIPLFAEELTRSLLEAGGGVLKSDAEVPESLEALLLARLDSLGDSKEVAQAGAVFGREFEPVLLTRILNRPMDRIMASVAALVEAHILVPPGRRGVAGRYVFRHALIQDAAYNSILKKRRRELHASVALTLEEDPDIREKRPEMLAHHLTGAGEFQRSTGYWQRAGELASSRSANVEAVSHYKQALAMIESSASEESEQKAYLLVRLSGGLRATAGFGAVVTGETCREASRLARRIGSTRHLLASLNGLYSFHLVRGEHTHAAAVAGEFLATAAEAGDQTYFMIGCRALGAVFFHCGILDKAVPFLADALSAYEPATHRDLLFTYGSDHGVLSASFLALTKLLQGNQSEARKLHDWAEAHARTLSHKFSVVQALAFEMFHYTILRDRAAARAKLRRLLALSERGSFAQMIAFARYQESVLAVDELTEEAVSNIVSVADAFQRVSPGNYRPMVLTTIAECRGAVGQSAEAHSCIDTALQLCKASGERWYEPETLRAGGVLYARDGNAMQAEQWLRAALRTAERQGALLWRLRTAVAACQWVRTEEWVAELKSVRAVIPADCRNSDTAEADSLLESELHA